MRLIKISFRSTVLISCCLHVSDFSQFSKCLNPWSEAVVYLPTLFGKTEVKQQAFSPLAWVHDHRVSSWNWFTLFCCVLNVKKVSK